MEDSDFEMSTDVPTEPRWLNTINRCSYVSAVGIELGYVQLGTGAARGMWFSFINGRDECLVSGGMADRENAKSIVEAFLEVEWEHEVLNDYPGSQEDR